MSVGKKILVLFAAFCLLVLTAENALAAYAWYTCKVIRTGQNSAGVCQITLARAGVTETRTFTLPAAQADRLLAIALSAVSANLQVRARVDWSLEEGRTVKGLEVVGPAQ